jgi:hypothetical protein
MIEAPTTLELGVTDHDIAEAMAPYVRERYATADPAWETIVRESARTQRRRRLRRHVLGWWSAKRRTQASIEPAYSRYWQTQALEEQVGTDGPVVPCVWRDAGLLARSIAMKRIHLLFLARVIARLRPAHVLEIGAGNSLNMFVLAAMCPGVRFTGLELTGGGIASATTTCRLPELPAAVQAFAPAPVVDPHPFSRISFVRGSAAALPFADRSVDLVMTVLALEQMKEIQHVALREIGRVARRAVAMLEPFFEWNARGTHRDYIVAHDYFTGAIRDLPGFGLAPMLATDDMPSKITFRAGLVVCGVDA